MKGFIKSGRNYQLEEQKFKKIQPKSRRRYHFKSDTVFNKVIHDLKNGRFLAIVIGDLKMATILINHQEPSLFIYNYIFR